MNKVKQLLVFGALVCTKISFSQNPFGTTGTINDQNIGLLNDRSVIFPSVSGYGNNQGYMLDPDTCLANYTYDYYIPPSYDGSEPYGIVIWINSLDNGSVKTNWKPVLDERKLIWVGVNNCGNTVYTHIRLSAAWAGLLRTKELLNIDTNRIYASGSSGGARVANCLAFIYPEVFKGAAPLCGASFPLEVPQDYETQDPDSHYEVILPFTTANYNYIRSFDQRFCVMTSYGDFRQGDIMNIYHGGHYPNNMKAKFLDHPGSHCATTTEEFRDAISFLENNFNEAFNTSWLYDENLFHQRFFGTGFQVQPNNVGVRIYPDNTIKAKIQFPWYNRAGSSIKFALATVANSNAVLGNNRSYVGLWGASSEANYCSLMGNETDSNHPGILVRTTYNAGTPTVHVFLSGVSTGIQEVFSAPLSTWTNGDKLECNIHLWEREMRLEFNHHMDTLAQVATHGSLLLADHRSIQLKWASCDIVDNTWLNAFAQGTWLTVRNQANTTTQAAGDLNLSLLASLVDQAPVTLNFSTLNLTHTGNSLQTTTGFTSYEWYLNGNLIPGATTTSLTISAYGTYLVRATDSYGCVHERTIQIASSAGLENETQSTFSVYPNPVESELNINAPVTINSWDVFALDGSLISAKCTLIQDGTTILRVADLEAGQYLLRLDLNGEQVYRRFVKF